MPDEIDLNEAEETAMERAWQSLDAQATAVQDQPRPGPSRKRWHWTDYVSRPQGRAPIRELSFAQSDSSLRSGHFRDALVERQLDGGAREQRARQDSLTLRRSTPEYFTGRRRDRAGRMRCYERGKPVACHLTGREHAEPGKGKHGPALPYRRGQGAASEHVASAVAAWREASRLRDGGQSETAESNLASVLVGMSTEELADLKSRLMVQSGGKKGEKAQERAERLAKAALAVVRGTGKPAKKEQLAQQVQDAGSSLAPLPQPAVAIPATIQPHSVPLSFAPDGKRPSSAQREEAAQQFIAMGNQAEARLREAGSHRAPHAASDGVWHATQAGKAKTRAELHDLAASFQADLARRVTTAEKQKDQRLAPSGPANLVQRAAAGDPAAQRELLDAHQSQITALTRSLLRNTGLAGEADDVAQEVSLALWQAMANGQFKPLEGDEGAFGRYLTKTVRRRVIDRLRKAGKRFGSLEAMGGEEGGGYDPEATDRGEAAQNETQARLQILSNIVDHLPEADRQLYDHMVAGTSGNEAAQAMGLSPAAYSARKVKLQARLREWAKLAQEGFSGKDTSGHCWEGGRMVQCAGEVESAQPKRNPSGGKPSEGPKTSETELDRLRDKIKAAPAYSADDLNAYLAAGGMVRIMTMTKATVYDRRHAGDFSNGPDGLYIRRGKGKDFLGRGDRLVVGMQLGRPASAPEPARPVDSARQERIASGGSNTGESTMIAWVKDDSHTVQRRQPRIRYTSADGRFTIMKDRSRTWYTLYGADGRFIGGFDNLDAAKSRAEQIKGD